MVVRVRGDQENDLDLESLMGVTRQAAEIFEKRTDIYWLQLLGKRLNGLSSETRRIAAIRVPTLRPYAYVGCSESFALRAFIQLIMHGLLLTGRVTGKVVTFKTEAEARAWIEEDRATRAMRSPPRVRLPARTP